GGGLIDETVDLASFLALNNSMGLSTIPAGAIIDSTGGTAGGSIAVGTVNFPASSLNWDPAITGVPGSVFPTTPLDCFGAPCSILGVVCNIRYPYVLNCSLNIQHALHSNLYLKVVYVV